MIYIYIYIIYHSIFYIYSKAMNHYPLTDFLDFLNNLTEYPLYVFICN